MARLVTVKSFNTPSEADCARLLLGAAGIEAYLADEALVGNFWTLGNAVGGVKLQVAEADWERASDLLEADEEARGAQPVGSAWKCARCGAAVEAGFEMCWQCGTSRDGIEDPDFARDEDDDGQEDYEPVDEAEIHEELRLERSQSDGNPFASPHAHFKAHENREEPEEVVDGSEAEGDALAERALRAAVFGLCCFPIVGCVYSVFLLMGLESSHLALSFRGRKQRRLAWRVNFGAFAFCGAVVAVVFALS